MVIKRELQMIQQRKSLILLEFFCGINRIYLLTNKKTLKCICYLYTFILVMVLAYFALSESARSSRHALTKYPPFTEELLLIVIILSFEGRKIEKFYSTLRKFDAMLKIVNLMTENKIIKVVLTVYILMPIIEVFSTFFIFYHLTYNNELFCTFCWIVTHDCEQIFHALNLRLVYLRITVLKAHVLKMFSANSSWCGGRSFSEAEKLCGKVELDINALHNAYLTLHKCSVQLNSAMGVSVSVDCNIR